MGGHALKNYETRRLTRTEYFQLANTVFDVLLRDLGVSPFLIPAYKFKSDFGDADFVLNADELSSNWVAQIVKAFDLTEDQWVKNGDVLSIGIENFQVDLIPVPGKYLLSTIDYFSYNDLGNLIGRIGHKLGVKIGHRGLSLVVRPVGRDDHIIEEIELTTEFDQGLELLGLDVKKFREGFNTLTEIYEYVASSKYFDPEIYALENRSYASRVRDKKRATYSGFVKWIEETKPKANHQFASKSDLGGYSLRMPYYETEVLTRWPEAKSKVDAAITRFEFNEEFKQVYNGKIVGELTGFAGKDLGEFMAEMRNQINDAVKHDWIKNPWKVAPAVMALYNDVMEDDS